MDDQHVLADIEAIDRAHFHAIHVLALDASLGHDICHRSSSTQYTRGGVKLPPMFYVRALLARHVCPCNCAADRVAAL
jgi:hypothetical protein